MTDKPDRLVDLADILDRTGLCRATIYKLIQHGKFPRPVKIGTRSKWRSSEFDRWFDGLTTGTAA